MAARAPRRPGPAGAHTKTNAELTWVLLIARRDGPIEVPATAGTYGGNKMRLYRGCNESNSATTFANTIVAAVSVMALVGVAGISEPAAQEAKSSVAHVEVVSGRVVAFSRGSPFLLDALDTITDRTRLDLQEHSELHICHYATRQLVVLTGPAQASISADGVTAQNGNAINASAGTCAAPQISRSQGGLVSRGVNFRQ